MMMPEFDVVTVAGRTTLHLNSDRIEECLNYARSHNIDCLAVIPVRGYKLRDLEFLKRHRDVADLAILFPPLPPFDVSAIHALTELRSLTLSDPITIALKQFPKLEVFRGVWCAGLDLSGCDLLNTLSLTKFGGGKTNDLTELPFMPALVDLALVQARVTSLNGIERFAGVKRLELAYLTKLERLDTLAGSTELERMECQNCPKLLGHHSVSVLSRLRCLRFNSCGEIPTLKFLDQMPLLEEFRFVNTSIADGDLRPLLRLKWVGFLPKKHYSHTPEQLDAVLRAKGGGALPRVE